MPYAGRPGISPAVAVLIALDRIRRGDRILDIGCGTGTDALLLAKWGFRRVDAIDADGRSIAIARGRATRSRLSDRVRFHHVAGERLIGRFPRGTFDVVLHTLVANNLTREKERHFREIAAVMKPEGLLMVQERIGREEENRRPGRLSPLDAMRRHFELTPGIATHLAEHRRFLVGPSYARVVLWLGKPRPERGSPR